MPPVYVGFGSMPMHTATDVAQVAVEAIRAQGRRAVLARSWAGLASAVAGTIRTDGATVAARLLLDVVGRERAPAST